MSHNLFRKSHLAKNLTLWKKTKSLCARCPTGRPIKYEPLDLAYVKKHKRNHFYGGKILVNFKGNFDIVPLCPNSLGWHPLTLPRPTQVWPKCHKIHPTNWSFMSSFGRYAIISNQSTKNVEIYIKHIRNLGISVFCVFEFIWPLELQNGQ